MEENGGMDGCELSVIKIPCVVKSTFVNSRLNIACNFAFTVYTVLSTATDLVEMRHLFLLNSFSHVFG